MRDQITTTTPSLTIPGALAGDRTVSPAAKLLDAARRALGASATPKDLALAIGVDVRDLEPLLSELRGRA